MSKGEPEKKPYRVESSTPGCSHCNRGAYWDVVGPGEIAESTSYANKEEAEDMADALNDAYTKGQKSMTESVGTLIDKLREMHGDPEDTDGEKAHA